jgi:hypothetical protein
MSAYRNAVTKERLRELLVYDPGTGIFTWIKQATPSVRIQIGDVAGTSHHGYRTISIDGVQYPAHRLAFLFMLGRWPVDQIDHVNLNRSDNRWLNLREATRSENAMNALVGRRNATGLKGVCKNGNKWSARITIDQHVFHLGSFPSPQEAHATYCRAAAEYHGKFARTS